MKHQKTYRNYFAQPVIWLDEVDQPLIHASLDGHWVSECFLEACVFHFELQDDGRSVCVSISEASQDAMDCNHANFNVWSEEAIKVLIDNEHVFVVDRENNQPLKKPMQKSTLGLKF